MTGNVTKLELFHLHLNSLYTKSAVFWDLRIDLRNVISNMARIQMH
jgi:hypothetical protein